MADQIHDGVGIERIDNLSIVSLKVVSDSLDSARGKLQLASPMRTAGGDPRSLWLGPDQWLLVSDAMTPASIVEYCEETLAGILHNAVDYSDGLEVLRIAGPTAREILASGSGIDFRPEKFPPHSCCRTRLAQVAAVVVANTTEQIDIYVERSYGHYLNDWLSDASSIAAHTAAIQDSYP